MSLSVRAAGLLAALALASAGTANAATPKQIDEAIKKGVGAIKMRFGTPPRADGEVGPTALAGIALLEAGVPGNDPVVKAITAHVRDRAYAQNRTYEVALCLMYLDRYGDPADVPLIQTLGVRLVIGQTSMGGWGYECCAAVPPADEQRLRAMKAVNQLVAGGGGVPPVTKLHPEVEKYGQALVAAKGQAGAGGGDDNSNTQFAVIGVWLARKHGVAVDDTLDRVERRFLATQSARTGGWSYAGPPPGGAAGADAPGSPAMHCAGLIGLAPGLARREERRMKLVPPKADPAAEPKKPDDPFFNPAKQPPDPKKPEPKRVPDARDRAVALALAGLGQIVAGSAREGRGPLVLKSGGHGEHDLYFMWSLERVGVIYGIDKFGGVDWYDAGAHAIVQAQAADGSWTGMHPADVNTAFALLFLVRSNLARDLSGKVQNDTATEMRAGAGPTGTDPKPVDPVGSVSPNPVAPPAVSGPVASEVGTLAAALVRASDKDWGAALAKLRDEKGAAYTQALVTAVGRLDGDRKRAAREALAERLTRMSAETLRGMARSEEAELRRGAVLAMAMRDDKAHVPDLAAALLDDEDLVVRAARAGLKSLAGQDFGPPANATAGQKRLAADAWKDWLSKQK